MESGPLSIFIRKMRRVNIISGLVRLLNISSGWHGFSTFYRRFFMPKVSAIDWNSQESGLSEDGDAKIDGIQEIIWSLEKLILTPLDSMDTSFVVAAGQAAQH